jgi:hypothetical protein
MAFSTYGELRQELLKEGIQWTVNPALSDSTPIRHPSLGGDLTRLPRAETLPRVDVAALVRATPTTNMLLRADLIKGGLLPPAAQTFGGTNATPAAGGAGAGGATGLRGNTGAQGSQGAQGATGPVGPQGLIENSFTISPVQAPGTISSSLTESVILLNNTSPDVVNFTLPSAGSGTAGKDIWIDGNDFSDNGDSMTIFAASGDAIIVHTAVVCNATPPAGLTCNLASFDINYRMHVVSDGNHHWYVVQWD